MTRFRMVLVVVGSALLFTFVGPFLYRAVGADSPVGTCSPVGNNSPVGDNSSVGNNSPVGSCSPVGTQAPTRIFNSLSGGGETGPVITVDPNTSVTDQATLKGDNISTDPATVTYTVYSLHSSDWQWGWDKVASGGTVTVTGGVVPPSQGGDARLRGLLVEGVVFRRRQQRPLDQPAGLGNRNRPSSLRMLDRGQLVVGAVLPALASGRQRQRRPGLRR